VAACAVWRPQPIAIAIAAALAAATAALVVRARRRELFLPPHLHELDRVVSRVLADPGHARRETSRGIAMSCYAMPDGRLDWVLSSRHRAWSVAAARRLATALWRDHAIVEGRAAGIVHVLVPHGAPPAPPVAPAPVASIAVLEDEDDLRLN
jgi:hypothetical protein